MKKVIQKVVVINSIFIACLCFIALIFFIPVQALPLHLIHMPPGFTITSYAKVPKARQMALGEDGIVFVGTLDDKVYGLIPNPNLTLAKKTVEVAHGLNHPNGVAYYKGSLYVAEVDKILKFKDIKLQLNQNSWPTPRVITDKLPKESHHGLRYIKFGPDGLLYVSLGVPCNICLSQDPRYGTIARMQNEGGHFEIYAKGIRNSMGFAWHPESRQLWFTDNGRDWLGDNEPPDELNFAPFPGMHFGFPFFNANKPDPGYYHYRNPNQVYTPPIIPLAPHVAPLGMVFYTGKMFPKEYHQKILIAEHGSWNRLLKIGYRIMSVTVDERNISTYQPFITGWLQGEHNWGRPVDLIVMPDGALLISDDYAGVIYRIAYKLGAGKPAQTGVSSL